MSRLGPIAAVLAVLVASFALAPAAVGGQIFGGNEQIAVNGEGATVVAALIPHNLSDPARIAVRDRGPSFSRPTTISLASELTTSPLVAIDKRGTALVVWASWHSGETTRLWRRRRAAGGEWGPRQALPASPAFLSRQTNPILASNQSGRALVAYGAGRNRSEALLGSTDEGFDKTIAIPGPAPWAVAMDSSGDSSLLLPSAQVVRISRTGAVSGRKPLNEGDDFLSDGAALATSGGGETVLWTGDADELRLSRRAAGRRFRRPRVLVRRDRSRLDAQDVVVAEDGSVVAAWIESPTGRPPVARLATVAPGGRVESATVSDPRFPVAGMDLAVGKKGNVVAVWGAPGFGVDAALRPRGGRFGSRFQLAPDGEGGYPAVAFDAHGRGTAAWQELQGDSYRQVARDFSSRRREPPVVVDREPAFKRTDRRRRCRPGGRTLLATPRVRIIGRGKRIDACYVPSGLRETLNGPLLGRVFPPPAIAVAGPLVAYALEGGFDEEDSGNTFVDVMDLRTGFTSERFAAESLVPASQDEFAAKVGSIALAPTGGVAWISCLSAPSSPLGDPRPTCDRTGPRNEVYKLDAGAARATLLDSGAGIDPRSLRRTGRSVTWRREGRLRSARLR